MRRFQQVDVFSEEPGLGNPVAVVHDADALDDASMLGFARETKLSETTFVQSASQAGADYRNRIWMTTRELPFAGHPSLGTAVAVAHARGDREVSYVQETRAGLQPVEVELGADGRSGRAAMLQEPAAFGPRPDPSAVVAALGLVDADLHPELAPAVVSCGVRHLMVLVRDETVLARPRLDALLLRPLLEEADAICAYVAWPDPGGEDVEARGYFLDGEVVAEDPATGSAAGPLCAYLHEHAGATRIAIAQGVAMGRPSRLFCEAGERVRVAGDVVILIDGQVEL